MESTRHEEHEKPAAGSIADRFRDREPLFDVVRFSAPWRPFGLRLSLRRRPKHR